MAKQAPVVTISTGKIKGAYQDKDQIAVFKGVPFAQPPVGNLRWRPPQPAIPWAGVRDATKFSLMAIQRMADFELFMSNLINGQGWSPVRAFVLKNLFKIIPQPKQSEDCLYLNVRTPQLETNANLPVMVWIHGCDHQDGSGSDVFYDSNALAHQGVVTVSINYRLGLMGYLAHPELSQESENNVSGNYGTLDQIAALQWVQENISAFGGDPNNVTIFGQSAGGESVIHMMTSPLAQGLFHKAIAQSPANGGQMVHHSASFLDFDSAERFGEKFAEALGISGNDQISRLREMSTNELYLLVREDRVLGNHYPCIDGHVLPKSPFESFTDGEQANVPLIIGSTADEGTLIYPILPTLLAEYRHRDQSGNRLPDFMEPTFGENLPQLLALYPKLDKGDHKARMDFAGDYMFGARTYFYAQHANRAGQPTYLYQFARTPSSPRQTGGAYHGAELSFVHGGQVPILPMTKADNELSAKMMRYWTNFAKTGDPNGSGNLKWPQFEAETPVWLRLNHEIEAQQVARQAQYDIFNQRTEQLVAEMKAMKVAA